MRAGFVSLVGRPNAGKSTLLNRLIGQKVAIVSDKPQTTRNRILAVKTLPDAQLVFLDTPGIHKPVHAMNARMVDVAIAAIRDVDVPVLVVDASEPKGRGDQFVLKLLEHVDTPLVLALNKVDCIDKPRLLPLIDSYRREREFAAIVPLSALTGEGTDILERELVAHLPEGEALYPPDFLTDRPERFFVTELVREKLLRHLRDELPYTTAVLLDRFEEPDARGLLRLACTILVEHDTQKGIVIGAGGAMIKRIGSEARLDLERFFDCRVFLELFVKVRNDWRDDQRVLRALGIED
ncbi:MAG: GTPase Era [Vicinamibacterales bacterium]